MGYLLTYRYCEGETLRYRQQITLLSVTADGAESAGLLSQQVRQQILQQLDDGTWLIELATERLEAQGPLVEALPAWAEPSVLTVRVDAAGTLRTVDGQEVPRLFPTLPVDPIEEGDAWEMLLPGAEGHLACTAVLEAVETTGEEQVARLVASTDLAGEADQSPRVEAVTTFSLTAGCILESSTVVDTMLEDGGSVSVVVDLLLEERQQHRPELGTY